MAATNRTGCIAHVVAGKARFFASRFASDDVGSGAKKDECFRKRTLAFLINAGRHIFPMKHILGFSSADRPTLIFREDGEVSEQELSGEVRMNFSPTVACIGYKSDEAHHNCANHAINVKQCPTCQFRDVARVYTVGDFTCYPHLYSVCQKETYIIYLAQFGADITKLGLTREARMKTRWKEQGADFAAPLLAFEGPDKAYPAEQLLQQTFDLANAVMMRQKITRLRFDRAKAQQKLERIITQVKANPAFSQNLYPDMSILDLAEHYPKVENPETVDFIGGEVLGAKSDWLFFEGPSGLRYAINMRQQIGRFALSKAENEAEVIL